MVRHSVRQYHCCRVGVLHCSAPTTFCNWTIALLDSTNKVPQSVHKAVEQNGKCECHLLVADCMQIELFAIVTSTRIALPCVAADMKKHHIESMPYSRQTAIQLWCDAIGPYTCALCPAVYAFGL